MQDPSAPTGDGAVKRWFEKAVTYKVSALLMIAAGAVLAWMGSSWVYPTFIPFLVAWILCFFLGLALSKIVRDRTWMSQKMAATIFLLTVALSYLPLVFYGEDVANAMVFPAMAALQGIGTAIGFHMPWLYGGKASHADVEGIDELMAALSKREK
jgi:hypothetical protein